MSSHSITQSTLEDVLLHYGFYEGHLESFRVIPQRLVNQNARFAVGGDEYVVKRYERGSIPENLEVSHKVQEILFDNGFPVARLELAKDGASLVWDGDAAYSVHRWVSGVHFEFLEPGATAPESLIDEVALNIGQYHTIIARHFGAESAPDLERVSSLVQSAIKSMRSLSAHRVRRLSPYMKLKFRWGKTNFERLLLDLYPVMSSLADELQIGVADHPISFGDELLGHNDINWQNFIFSEGGKLLALIDFDNMQTVPRLLEVGYAALVVVGADQEKLERFVNMYRQSYGGSVEVDVVRFAMKLRCVRSYCWAFQSYVNGRIEDEKMLESWISHLGVCSKKLV